MIIYKAKNKITGKVYVGQTKSSIEQRWRYHCSPSSTFCRHLHNAIMKYGKETFELSILATAETRDELNSLEAHFIKEENCLSPNGYNLLLGGSARDHHPETKLKMSLSHKGMKMTGKAAAGVPRGPRPESVGKNISAAKKGWNGLWGKKRPGIEKPSTRRKVEAINDFGEKLVFGSIKSGASYFNVTQGNIVACLNGRRPKSCGCRWFYLD